MFAVLENYNLVVRVIFIPLFDMRNKGQRKRVKLVVIIHDTFRVFLFQY